jgi:hypothetical protein
MTFFTDWDIHAFVLAHNMKKLTGSYRPILKKLHQDAGYSPIRTSRQKSRSMVSG